MKNIFSIFILGFSLFFFNALQVNAQQRNIDDTWFALKNNELQRAKKSIDEAYVHETTKNSARMFYYRGMVYLRIAALAQTDPKMRELEPNSDLIVAEAFYQYLTSNDKKKKSETDEILSNIVVAGSLCLNRAQDFIDVEDYGNAIPYFDATIKLIQLDTREAFKKVELSENKLLENMYTLATLNNDHKSARNYINRMLDNGYEKPELFIFLARSYFESGDSASGVKALEDGRKLYPDSKDILIEEINYYLAKDETDKLLNKFNEAIAAEPNNDRFYFFRGTLYHQKKLYELAETDYRKSLELNPNAIDVKFNMGAIYVDMAAPIINKMNANAGNIALYDKLEEEKNALYSKALPFLEEVYQSGEITEKSELLKLVEILRDTYKSKRDREKMKFYQSELERIRSEK